MYTHTNKQKYVLLCMYKFSCGSIIFITGLIHSHLRLLLLTFSQLQNASKGLFTHQNDKFPYPFIRVYFN